MVVTLLACDLVVNPSAFMLSSVSTLHTILRNTVMGTHYFGTVCPEDWNVDAEQGCRGSAAPVLAYVSWLVLAVAAAADSAPRSSR